MKNINNKSANVILKYFVAKKNRLSAVLSILHEN